MSNLEILTAAINSRSFVTLKYNGNDREFYPVAIGMLNTGRMAVLGIKEEETFGDYRACVRCYHIDKIADAEISGNDLFEVDRSGNAFKFLVSRGKMFAQIDAQNAVTLQTA